MKRILSIIVLALAMTGAFAQQITEQEAMERALQYMSSGKATNGRMLAPARKGSIKLESAPVEADRIYAFNVENGGFIVASADSRTLPVLGYSTTGNIDWDNMPDNMREWLKSYDEAIATLGDRTDFVDGNSTNMAPTRQDRTPVESLIKTHWDQTAPYWNQTPVYNGDDPNLKGRQCLTGCMATALAQVMNYYQWPKTVPNGIPDYDFDTEYNGNQKILHIDALPPVTFDWANMLNDYVRINPDTWQNELLGTPAQHEAVATLMRYCGQAVKIYYSPDFSGGYLNDYKNAILDYFGYASAQLLNHRYAFGIDEWEGIIYDELADGRPVIYCGLDVIAGGHAFVCDGYDGNGLFHINWGWGGYGDGYFSLSVLNPYSLEDGNSGSYGMGFSSNQGVVVHINPTEKMKPVGYSTEEEVFQYSNIYLVNNNTAIFRFHYDKDDAGSVTQDYAFGTVADNGTLNPDFIGNPNDSIVYSTNRMTVVIDSTRFQPGDSLRLYPMQRFRKPGAEWRVIPPLESHIVAGRTDNGLFFINIHGTVINLECIDGAISKGTGRLGDLCDVTVSVKNLSDKDYIDLLYLVPLYYGHINKDQTDGTKPLSQGGKMKNVAYIRSGQTDQVTFSFIPQRGGLVLFKLITEDQKNPGYFTLELNNDTLVNYNNYIENNSWLSHEGDKWFYNIELRDKPDINMPHWIPSDSIGLKARLFWGDEQVDSIFIRDEIREYLTLLPEKGGDGDYIFSYRMPIEIRPDCEISMDSYLGEWINNCMTKECCEHDYIFRYTDLTIVKQVDAQQNDEPYYDLLGRPINGVPQEKGLYIKGNRKVYIK